MEWRGRQVERALKQAEMRNGEEKFFLKIKKICSFLHWETGWMVVLFSGFSVQTAMGWDTV